METDANRESDGGVNRYAQERIEPEPKVEEVRPVRAEHDELAVRDVHDFGDAPDEVQAVRDDREDAAEQQAEGEVRHEQRDVGHAAPRASGLCTRVLILARANRHLALEGALLYPRPP